MPDSFTGVLSALALQRGSMDLIYLDAQVIQE